jgi:hypothetical protein
MSLRDRLHASTHAREYTRREPDVYAPAPAVLEPVRAAVRIGFLIALAVVTVFVCGVCTGAIVARAQPELSGADAQQWTGSASSARVDPAEHRLALAIAKVAVNEASLVAIRPDDVALIAQCTEQHGDDAATKLRWLTSHSSCVLTDRALRPGEVRSNCIWTRELADNDRRPPSLTQPIDWRRYVERWRDVRATALALVQHRSQVPYPCTGRPVTWGSRTLDLRRAIDRGLRPLVCSTRGNVGFERGGES